ncbi:hypothetical protein [Candidatus Hamiltonella defensa]|uniref:hypothetical protein n=1 Tax=Candidatus Williamhamiltonella defendens TaxID=138072 RepID=UPI0012FDE843|nr:hypothetical protein [Candidatus Hamiltonella defensa]
MFSQEFTPELKREVTNLVMKKITRIAKRVIQAHQASVLLTSRLKVLRAYKNT